MKNQLIINNKEVELSPESWKNMEKQFKKKSFYPEKGDIVFVISTGKVKTVIDKIMYSSIFKVDFDCGLAFKTRPEAEAKLAEMKAIRAETIKKWDSLGFLDGLSGHVREDIAKLYECCKSKKKK
jgi:hypothetical protein